MDRRQSERGCKKGLPEGKATLKAYRQALKLRVDQTALSQAKEQKAAQSACQKSPEYKYKEMVGAVRDLAVGEKNLFHL